MKKFVYLLSTSILFIFFYSCESEPSDLESQSTENLEAKEVFFKGKIQQAKSIKVSSRSFECGGVTGPNCASPNQLLTYISTAANPNIKWTINSGDISILRGQGTKKVTLNFGSNFAGGYVTAFDVKSQNCYTKFEILKCDGVGIITSNNCKINFDSYSTGPYGQVDVRMKKGSRPFKVYKNGRLLHSGSQENMTVAFGCDGGVLKVEANTPCGIVSKSTIIRKGCAPHPNNPPRPY